MGKLFVIEGLDGSGKATQANLLFENLKKSGRQVKKVSFPDYESPSSSLIKMYLGGDFGQRPEDVNAFAASAFYAVDRYASFKKSWKDFYDDGGIIIADRYTTSNAVHQCGKLAKNEWDAYLDWLFDFEYDKMCIPRPDCVIYLDMTPKVSQGLISSRYGGNEQKKDIHEKNAGHLAHAREAAMYCAEKLGWYKISCDDGAVPYKIEEIAQQVLRAASTRM